MLLGGYHNKAKQRSFVLILLNSQLLLLLLLIIIIARLITVRRKGGREVVWCTDRHYTKGGKMTYLRGYFALPSFPSNILLSLLCLAHAHWYIW